MATTPTLSLTEAHAQAEAASQAADERLPALRARRQALALDALTNRQAERELSTVEEQITTLERDRERADLVVAEVRARETAAAEAAAQAERDRQLAELDTLQRQVDGHLAEVEQALVGLGAAVKVAVTTYRELHGRAHNLGVAQQRGITWDIKRRLVWRLQTVLSPTLHPEIDVVFHAHREIARVPLHTNTEETDGN
jgi:DNA repair exonuclease SbcCD ATPase subunit